MPIIDAPANLANGNDGMLLASGEQAEVSFEPGGSELRIVACSEEPLFARPGTAPAVMYGAMRHP
jgi:hypothetical protein